MNSSFTVHCSWSSWDSCSTTCGPGIQFRQIKTKPQNGGQECLGQDWQHCNLKDCPKGKKVY